MRLECPERETPFASLDPAQNQIRVRRPDERLGISGYAGPSAYSDEGEHPFRRVRTPQSERSDAGRLIVREVVESVKRSRAKSEGRREVQAGMGCRARGWRLKPLPCSALPRGARLTRGLGGANLAHGLAAQLQTMGVVNPPVEEFRRRPWDRRSARASAPPATGKTRTKDRA